MRYVHESRDAAMQHTYVHTRMAGGVRGANCCAVDLMDQITYTHTYKRHTYWSGRASWYNTNKYMRAAYTFNSIKIQISSAFKKTSEDTTRKVNTNYASLFKCLKILILRINNGLFLPKNWTCYSNALSASVKHSFIVCCEKKCLDKRMEKFTIKTVKYDMITESQTLQKYIKGK